MMKQDGKGIQLLIEISKPKASLNFDIGFVPDGPINAVAVMDDSRLIIGGDFIYVGEIYSPSIAVLNIETGKVDVSIPFNATVRVLGLNVEPSTFTTNT